MSIFQDTKVSKAFDALVNLAGSHHNNVIGDDLGDYDSFGGRAKDTSEIGAAIAELKAAFQSVAKHIHQDDLQFAVRKVTELVDFQGREKTGGRVVQKDWSQYLIAFEAMAQARPDLYKWTEFERSLSDVAKLGEGARVVQESAVFVNSGVEVADPRPAAVRSMLARLDARADA